MSGEEQPQRNQTDINTDSSQGDSPNLAGTNIVRQHEFDERKFKETIKKYDISQFFSKKLLSLKAFKIVFILDDSGSMNQKLDESPLNKGSFQATRWDELQEFIKISIEIANILNGNGCDVYFLNRPMARGINKFADLTRHFHNKPSGFTPLTKIFNKVLKNNMASQDKQKLLVIIVTDGEPTNPEGKVDIKSFKECLISRPSNVYTTILACTDESDSMEYLNNWDKYIQRLDVVDDFRSERKEVQRAKGINFHFTYGDYVAKSLIGSTDPTVDNLVNEQNMNCCIIS